MISYQLTSDDELIVHGTMEPGEKLPSMCCKGFMWEVSETFPDDDPGSVSVWGHCENPNCPHETDNHWHGISSCLQVDIAAHLLDMAEAGEGE
jgi:hypothetical protein